jgi:uncharacterized protein (TIRG00374 family)
MKQAASLSQPKWRKLGYLIWLALPLALWLTLRAIPLDEIRIILRQLGPVQIGILIAANLLITLLFSARWWLILRAQGHHVPYFSLAGYRLAGFAISYFTPGTQFGGEPLQVYLLEKRHGISTATALASVTLDKLHELLANFTFLIIGVIFILQGGFLAGLADSPALFWSSGLLLLPLFYLLVLLAGRFPLTWLAVRLPTRWITHPVMKKTLPLVASTERQISSLFRQHPMTLLWVLFSSGLVWVLTVTEYWLMLYFLDAHLDLFQTISALTAARLAFLTPIPGALGTLEAGQAFALQAFGYPLALGISLSLLIRLRDTSLGLLGLWWGAVLARRPHADPLPQKINDRNLILDELLLNKENCT